MSFNIRKRMALTQDRDVVVVEVVMSAADAIALSQFLEHSLKQRHTPVNEGWTVSRPVCRTY